VLCTNTSSAERHLKKGRKRKAPKMTTWRKKRRRNRSKEKREVKVKKTEAATEKVRDTRTCESLLSFAIHQ